MVRGFVPEFTQGGERVVFWFSGDPKRGGWTGVKKGDHIKMKVRIYRCNKCGYLEPYAFEENTDEGD